MPSKNSRGQGKGRARRHEILLVALNAFAEQGFRASSMREIADLVGLSRAGLLHHFSAKEELVRLYTVLAGESVSPGHPVREYFLDCYTTVRERVAHRLRDARDQGEIKAGADVAFLPGSRN